MNKDRKKKVLVEGLPIVVAVVALVVSFRSCSTSDEALELTKADFQSSRSIVLTGAFPEKEDEIRFAPLSQDMKIVTLTVHDPKRILEDGYEFKGPSFFETDPPGTWTYLDGIKKVITDYQLESACKGQPGNVMVVARIPVIIETSYLVKGTRLHDTSIYGLKYVFYREGDQEGNTERSFVMFRNVEFVSRIPPRDSMRMLKDLAGDEPLVVRFSGEQSDALDEK